MTGRLAIFSLCCIVLITACSQQASTQTAKTRIIYGLTLQPSGIDPHINSSSELGIPLRQVYDTLVYRNPQTGELTPGLASDWSVSEDGLAYTFRLRQDVRFHDGAVFNSRAVGANLDRITDPALASQKAVFMLGPYVGYDLIDEYTIRIRLAEPFSPLLDSLAQVYLGIASPAALAQYTPNRYQFHQVGTGPYTFEEYIPGDRIILRKNPEYHWGPAFYTGLAQGVEEIEFRFFTDPPSRLLALERGGAQIMGEILPSDARGLTANSAVQLVPVTIAGQPLQFIFNTRRFPTDNRSVRQAILFGTNRNEIVDAVYQRFSPVAWGPLSASTLYYNREMNGLYPYDVSRSRQLLTDAGFQDTNGDGILDIGGLDIEVTVIVPPWGLIPQVAQLIQDQWRVLGIRANLIPVPTRSALIEAVNSGEYNLVAFYSFGYDPSLLNSYFLSTGSENWTGYASQELDNLLIEGVRQRDPNVRRSLYAQVQRLIMDEALILPIRDYVNLNGVAANVQGLTFDAYGWFPLLPNLTLQPTS